MSKRIIRDKLAKVGIRGAISWAYRRAISPPYSWGQFRMPYYFLKGLNGVIHVGANLGQERDLYDKFSLNVLWIEPIPDIFTDLCKNIQTYPKQKAVNALITDVDGGEYTFNVANNHGESSSIMEFGRHKEIWPDVHYVEKIQLRSRTLDNVLSDVQPAGSDVYDALIIDTQGAEMLVLKGAAKSLAGFKYVKAEAANFESYEGGASSDEIMELMTNAGFRLVRTDLWEVSLDGGSGKCFDLLFKNNRDR